MEFNRELQLTADLTCSSIVPITDKFPSSPLGWNFLWRGQKTVKGKPEIATEILVS